MNMFELLIGAPVISIVLFGLYRLKHVLKDIKLGSISSVLIAMVSTLRFMSYAGVVAITLFFAFSLISTDAPRPPLLQHSFKIELQNPAYSISDISGLTTANASIKDLSGNVNIVGNDWIVSTLVLLAVSTILLLLHWILLYAERVLRSIALRMPFTEENAICTKKISFLIIGLWISYTIYQVAMTTYLQSKLAIEGVQLELVNISIFESLFIAGLVYLLAEVFRVGYELSQDQSLTV